MEPYPSSNLIVFRVRIALQSATLALMLLGGAASANSGASVGKNDEIESRNVGARRPIAPEHFQPAINFMQAECTGGRFSGVMAILQHGEQVAQMACGQTSYPDGPPISADIRFKVFSTSKQFTAAAIMLQTRDGVLSLDDPLGRYVPEAPAAWRAVTIRQLLNHTAGIPNQVDAYFTLYRDGWEQGLRAWMAQVGDLPTDFVPGTRFSYSNMGYELLALAGSRASGQPWAHVLEQRIFAQTGMATAIVEQPSLVDGTPSGPLPDQQLAPGYIGEPSQIEQAQSNVFVLQGSGAIHARLADFAAYDRALLAGTFLTRGEQALMAEKTVTAERTVGYGFGWVISRTPAGHKVVSHSGGTNGYAVDLARIPERGIALLLFSNFGFSDVDTYREKILAMLDPASCQGDIASGEIPDTDC